MSFKVEWANGTYAAQVPGREAPLPTDQWLAAPERSFDEIDAILERRLLGIQANFESPIHKSGTRNFLQEKYGLKEPANHDLARLLAYAELSDEYIQRSQDYRTHETTLGTIYEARKHKINAEPGEKGKDAKKRKLREEFIGPINSAVNEANTAAMIREQILKKAVLDSLSINQSGNAPTILTIPDVLHDAQKLINSSASSFIKDRQPVSSLLEGLTSYLIQTRDKTVFSRYQYRHNPELTQTEADCQILDRVLVFTLDPASQTDDPEKASVLSSLGRAYIHFLNHRAGYLSSNLAEQGYPYLSTLYDLYTSAYQRGNHTVLSGLPQLIDEAFAESLHAGVANIERKRFIRNVETTVASFYGEIDEELPHIITKLMQGDVSLEGIPQVAREVISSTEDRIIDGLDLVNSSGRYARSKAVALLIEPIVNELRAFNAKFVAKGETANINQENLNSFMGTAPVVAINSSRGIDIDLRLIVGRVRKYVDGRRQEPGSTVKLLPELENLMRTYRNLSKIEQEFYLARIFMEEAFGQSTADQERLGRENEFLWSSILDSPIKFVSPRGDRFSIRNNNDPELGAYGIESLRFNIDKTRPREHKVTLQLLGLEYPVVFWLDTEKNLLGSERQPVAINPSQRQEFLNIVLKRLYTITSGDMETAEEVEYEDEKGYKFILYRRAFYRKLVSTPERPYTLESYSAKAHASEILAKYGINIHKENERRKEAGTLRRNEFLTFVRDVEPEEILAVPEEERKPNDLKYDPDIPRLPI